MLSEKLDQFDPNLGFTMKNTTDNRLNSNAVFPKNYKIGALIGELYRFHHLTTTVEARDRAIEKFEYIFLKNHFPRQFARSENKKKSVIAIVRNQNIRKNVKKTSKTQIFEITLSASHTLV